MLHCDFSALYNYMQPIGDFSEQTLQDLLASRRALWELYEKSLKLTPMTSEKIESLIQVCAEGSKEFMFYSNLVVKLIKAGPAEQLRPYKEQLIRVLRSRLKQLSQSDDRTYGLSSFDIDDWSSVNKFRVLCAENYLAGTTETTDALIEAGCRISQGEQEIISKEQCVYLLMECFSFGRQYSIQQFNEELCSLEHDGCEEFAWILYIQSMQVRARIEQYFAAFTDEQLQAWVIQRVSCYAINLAVKQISAEEFIKKSLELLTSYGIRVDELSTAFFQINKRCKEIMQ